MKHRSAQYWLTIAAIIATVVGASAVGVSLALGGDPLDGIFGVHENTGTETFLMEGGALIAALGLALAILSTGLYVWRQARSLFNKK